MRLIKESGGSHSCVQLAGLSTMNFKNSMNEYYHYIVYTLLTVTLLYILLLSSSTKSINFALYQNSVCQPSNTFNIKTHGDKLDEALAGASTEDKTIIITIVNKAYVEGDKPMLDIFLDGFWLGEGTEDLIKHLLIITMDQTSYKRCMFLHLHCYKLETDGVDFIGEKLYMSKDFIKMMWERTRFLGDILKRGYSFVFTDTDVLWLRNPFPRLSHNNSIDLQISTDEFNGNQWSEANLINTGFYMIRSNNRTIAFFDKWYAKKDNSTGLKEQDVLQSMIRGGELRNLGLKVRFLDTVYFSGFCQNSKDVRSVVTVHSNCCRRIRSKTADLTVVIHDWKRFMRATENETSWFQWTPHDHCRDSWRH